jgi:hypothetical protein
MDMNWEQKLACIKAEGMALGEGRLTKFEGLGMGANGEVDVYADNNGAYFVALSNLYTYERDCNQSQLKAKLWQELLKTQGSFIYRKPQGHKGFTYFLSLPGMVSFSLYSQGQKKQNSVMKDRLGYFACGQVSALRGTTALQGPWQWQDFEQGFSACLSNLQKKKRCAQTKNNHREDVSEIERLRAMVRTLQAENEQLRIQVSHQAMCPTDRRPCKRKRPDVALVDDLLAPPCKQPKNSFDWEFSVYDSDDLVTNPAPTLCSSPLELGAWNGNVPRSSSSLIYSEDAEDAYVSAFLKFD